MDSLKKARQAREWPTIQELAETYHLRYHLIRREIANGNIDAYRLNIIRVNPESFAEWMEERQKVINAR